MSTGEPFFHVLVSPVFSDPQRWPHQPLPEHSQRDLTVTGLQWVEDLRPLTVLGLWFPGTFQGSLPVKRPHFPKLSSGQKTHFLKLFKARQIKQMATPNSTSHYQSFCTSSRFKIRAVLEGSKLFAKDSKWA